MSRPARLIQARIRAEAVAQRFGVTEAPVDVLTIAERSGIVVEAKPAEAQGVSGMLLRHGDEFGILYATHVGGSGFQRFSIAHELGHYFLDGHCDQLLENGAHVSRAGQGSPDPFEQEADAFAASLLMPSRLFEARLRTDEPSLDLVLRLAGEFDTSLVSTAIRLAERSRRPVAVLTSASGVLEVCAVSDAMKVHARRGWLRRGDRVPLGSRTSKLAREVPRVSRSDREVGVADIADWYDCGMPVPGREEVIGLGRYGRVLTVLTCDTVQDNEDVDTCEEADLLERWTPRFHR